MRRDNQGILVSKIGERGLALGIKVGDRILKINDSEVRDIIDYRFLIADNYLKLKILRGDRELVIEVEKDYDEDLGIELKPFTYRRCSSRCIFCFVDQLPQGLRKSLYFKDDDYRLSFLYGNYITLTNLSRRDYQRIIIQRLSPLYISVHSTEPSLRSLLLGSAKAGGILKNMEILAKGGILMHAQIVLCPGINDGRHLERTLADLASLWPQVRSVAIVPVGLTKFRETLHPLQSIDETYARELLKAVKKWQRRFKEQFNSYFVFPSDEFYLLASEPLPPYESYEGYFQIENGVGITRQFLEGFQKIEPHLPEYLRFPRRVTVVTGVLAAETMTSIVQRLNSIRGVEINLTVVENDFFGHTVTVAGLLTGRDILAHLKGKDLGDSVLIPDLALKEGEGLFLDDLSLGELEKKLGVKVEAVPPEAKILVAKILGRD